MLSNVTPLQYKYDLFLNPASFHVLRNLLCTRNLINYGCQRPLKFILLHLTLVDKILRCENVCDCGHANDNLELFQDFKENNGGPHNTSIEIRRDGSEVACTL
jgi:hypothetical protein